MAVTLEEELFHRKLTREGFLISASAAIWRYDKKQISHNVFQKGFRHANRIPFQSLSLSGIVIYFSILFKID
jgi:hypothetical protein